MIVVIAQAGLVVASVFTSIYARTIRESSRDLGSDLYLHLTFTIIPVKMPSIRNIVGVVAVGLVTVVSALPAQPRLNPRALKAYDVMRRQNPATGLPDGLGDVDILQLCASTFPQTQSSSANQTIAP